MTYPNPHQQQVIDHLHGPLLVLAPAGTAKTRIMSDRLYELRTAFLRDKTGYGPKPSGGAHRGPWPAVVGAFLEGFLPLQPPQLSTRGG